uniref:hypothetical protein n=1 Tax=Amycolatopsis sp. CA-096443 TaxID=3239919 RepID=UPI003F496B55
MIATVAAALGALPYAWVAQTRAGGVIVAPVRTDYVGGGPLARFTVHTDDTATGRPVSKVAFMPLRQQRTPDPRVSTVAFEDEALDDEAEFTRIETGPWRVAETFDVRWATHPGHPLPLGTPATDRQPPAASAVVRRPRLIMGDRPLRPDRRPVPDPPARPPPTLERDRNRLPPLARPRRTRRRRPAARHHTHQPDDRFAGGDDPRRPQITGRYATSAASGCAASPGSSAKTSATATRRCGAGGRLALIRSTLTARVATSHGDGRHQPALYLRPVFDSGSSRLVRAARPADAQA